MVARLLVGEWLLWRFRKVKPIAVGTAWNRWISSCNQLEAKRLEHLPCSVSRKLGLDTGLHIGQIEPRCHFKRLFGERFANTLALMRRSDDYIMDLPVTNAVGAMNFKPGYPHGMSMVVVSQIRSEKEAGTLVRQAIQVNILMDILVGRKLAQKPHEHLGAFKLRSPCFIGEHEFNTNISLCGVHCHLRLNNSRGLPAHIN